MHYLQSLILGIIQGITEFLPISSSGHLMLLQSMFGWDNLSENLLFNLFSHLGTVVSILIVFRTEIKRILQKDWFYAGLIILAIFPLIPAVFFLHQLKDLVSTIKYLWIFFALTALLIFLSGKKENKLQNWLSKVPEKKRSIYTALITGAVQVLALFPGLSRSGSTISTAKLCGWSYERAIKFSFLLSIPTVMGGVFLETKEILAKHQEIGSIPLSHYIIGFTASLLMGIISLNWLLKLAKRGSLVFFGWYCLLISLFSFFYVRFSQS